jgi:RND family efflux transporter MFP subunit
MNKLAKWIVLGVAPAVVLLGCSSSDDQAKANAPASQLKVQVMALEKAPLERVVDGTIEAINQATVSAQTSGRITEIFYDVNDFVPAGALIMKLRATEQRAGMQQAQAAVQQAATREQEARQQFARVEGLYKDKVATKAEYDTALANRDAAQAQLAAARAGLGAAQEGVAYTEVRAPYAGIVTRRMVEVGETVQPGSPLMSGVSLQYLRVNVELPQSVVEKVRAIRKAAIYVDSKRVEATSFTVFPEADAATHTFHARANLPANATDLHPGMFVKVGLVVGEADRLLIPVTALVTRSEVTAVYVLSKAGAASLRQIRVGQRFAERVEVLAGLSVGDQVVLDPVAAMQMASTQ